MIYSEAFAKLFKPSDLSETKLVEKQALYYICKGVCQDSISSILTAIPSDWQINIKEEGEILARFLFDDEWFEETWETFLTYIRYYLGN